MQRRLYHFSGHVQGVGFRCTAKNISLQYDVNGYVKNLPDGRVEMLIEGEDRQVDQLVQDINSRMGDYIRRVDRHDLPATGELHGFTIAH
jgi:acylphosphatase